ncbi:hypothetical protein A3H80_01230 [Candidatus Roizmanbacteria bacterium RIFCSPLOWO2_02_FULL_37_19]|uniref:Uncharacterized protein n=1 Tax=Candidatus Roizmanbacteria bacterium RIFCSPHIGHO2_02_FULL_37_24 TaxID=1802037 RepID=A0A1F7GU34_9BACT|nr:MAG: hypothetical protein A2862_00570 [Candidatus Roizmanbacteria bacterium RIFCSPHIGHO2_01_FULL_38_41]OGK22560.1 MAG: hypothetical protein A3C24_05350 [Candidatus Roizmanbacteria bacterium RIFCSPHIGHO2_02_FULL_37_24]OGK32717.1 MAG: hypothetical protein A3E10_00335 [Candidatus Roizmanbacteria bacterium RIFCSPHIGHO2_12_FULL_37_23]OGK45270.1 MAG: hypothetical protein A2956_01930 [Candidatus Roizmanbacteria bacterium RIFCSPLOWO2_01_FULL_37_57]OGK54223.1 MAG: hypothetical protein A3H80_01230 [Ca
MNMSTRILVNKSLEDASSNPQQVLENTLKSIFPTSQEENKLHRARSILGETVQDLPDSILESFITELEYLAVSWLDDYEQTVFEGFTLDELLKGAKP